MLTIFYEIGFNIVVAEILIPFTAMSIFHFKISIQVLVGFLGDMYTPGDEWQKALKKHEETWYIGYMKTVQIWEYQLLCP